MQALLDADVLRYEVGFAAKAGWKGDGEPSWEYVQECLTLLINNIQGVVGATCPPILFFTGKTNFRNNIAVTTPYKERASNKPFHYYNLTAYMKAVYKWRQEEGFEADDLMAIEQEKRNKEYLNDPIGTIPTIICTRDKDLRAVPGWHYGWELGNQPAYGPKLVDEFGAIKLSTDRKSIKGEGLLFFYAQCLTGDPTDTIPGLKGCGAVQAFKTLDGCVDTNDAFKRVLGAYKAVYEHDAKARLLEQGKLLWMTRETHPDGSPVLWKFPDGPWDTEETAPDNVDNVNGHPDFSNIGSTVVSIVNQNSVV